MTDISGIFSISSSTKHQWISLCGHLEAVIGNYFLSQSGNPGAYWYAIYYDSSVDGYNECVEITDKNLILCFIVNLLAVPVLMMKRHCSTS